MAINHGLQIGHDLTGMGPFGQAIDYRNSCMRCQIQQLLVAETADHDRVNKTRQHPRCILNRLTTSQLHITG